MTARYLVGDVFDRLGDVPDGSVDVVLTSPPFLALRSYLPPTHLDKGKEIGAERAPADYLNTLLSLTAELKRVLAPHGSLAVELADTYAGSGGSGGDYAAGGLRSGQARWQGSAAVARTGLTDGRRSHTPRMGERSGWPLPKSLCGIPQAFMLSLAYGRNVLNGRPSPAGRWRVRNVKAWVKTNPPPGALSDKERPATSYVTVAALSADRWFDLDAVRSPAIDQRPRTTNGTKQLDGDPHEVQTANYRRRLPSNPAGGPPADWWHHVDAVLDACLREAGRAATNHSGASRLGGETTDEVPLCGQPPGVVLRGWHLRRALEQAGILTMAEALDVASKGYGGSHYATWPAELCGLLITEMCPRRVCRTCGRPSRRLVETERRRPPDDSQRRKNANGQRPHPGRQDRAPEVGWQIDRTTTAWSSCGCSGTDGLRLDGFHTGPGWRPGVVLDPFAGTGTTGAVAMGLGRDCVLIDIDERNVELARERIGMFLDVDVGQQATSEARAEEV